MRTTLSYDPVTRIEGHLRIEIETDTVGGVPQVVDAVSIPVIAASFIRSPEQAEQQLREGLEGNLCRCTGYHNIVKAIAAAAEVMHGRRSEIARAAE